MKEFKIFAENIHEYDIFVDDADCGTAYSLHYSGATHWTNPNELIISAIDHGNGIKLSEKIGKSLDYSEFGNIALLFNFILNVDISMAPKYNVIRVDENSFDI